MPGRPVVGALDEHASGGIDEFHPGIRLALGADRPIDGDVL